MATIVLTDAFVSVFGNDISNRVQQVSLSYQADSVEETAMGDSAHVFKGGLKNWSVSLDMKTDFAASQLDALLFPLVGTTGTVLIRPSSAVMGGSNPQYSGPALLTEYTPLGNRVGELAGGAVSLVPAGTGLLTRATS